MKTAPRTLVTADLTECDALAALAPGAVEALFVSALSDAGATIVKATSHYFPGQGLTSVLILAESHAVLHTWPETGTAHVDIFTCSGALAVDRAIDALRRGLGAGHVSVRRTPRAVGAPVAPAAGAPRQPSGAGTAGATPGFVARAAAVTFGLLAAWRLPWVQEHLLWPLTAFQERLVAMSGAPVGAVQVDLSCSGADTIAILAGAILGWPARWPARVMGALVGVAGIIALNLVRIATLAGATGSPAWFDALHVYIWPMGLTIAVAAYFFAWLSLVDRRPAPPADRPPDGGPRWSPRTRFALTTMAAIVVFMGTAPWFITTRPVETLAAWMAGWAAAGLGLVGATASAQGQILSTARGAFLVTGECIATPLIPVGVAAALTLPRTWRLRVAALAATGPLFVALGVVRLFVLALPSAVVAAPETWAHAFFQVVTAGAIVAGAAIWRGRMGRGPATRVGGRAAAAMATGVGVALLLGERYAEVVQQAAARLAAQPWPAGPDPQGTLALLPPYQVGLFVALMTAWFGLVPRGRQALAALALLVASQVALFVALGFVTDREALSVPLLRAWAVAWPVALSAIAVPWPAAFFPDLTSRPGLRYRRFWEGVGERFPDLGGAPSTAYYFDNEQRLFTEHLPPLGGLTLLKTDLWDEARNTRILQWAASQGAHVHGVDISAPTARMARDGFHRGRLGAVAADCRSLPYADGWCDAVYSMGTIEHDERPEDAIAEMYRVLKPGGRAIVGVPNRFDPFLRPVLARVMQALGLYAYGSERSYSRRALRRMLEDAGFVVSAETAILFVPGWLRMLDLACHVWWPPATRVTSALIAPFVWLDAHVPFVRRHGYLLATVAVKPDAPKA